jgi:hypothetical protein
MWLHRVSESGRARRHAPDFFVRRAGGTSVLIDVRPGNRISAADSAVFAAAAVMAGQAGWAYDRGAGAASSRRQAQLRRSGTGLMLSRRLQIVLGSNRRSWRRRALCTPQSST